MTDPSASSGLYTTLIAFIAVIRFINNLLKAGYFGLGQISLLSLAERAKETDRALKYYLNDPIKLHLASQILDKVSLLVLGALIVLVIPDPTQTHFALFLGYLLVFDLLLPTTAAAYFPEALVTRLFPALRIIFPFQLPLVLLLARIAEHGKGLEDEDEEEDEEDVSAFLRAGAEEGIIEEKEKSMLRKVLEFNDTVVREVMTPRTDMECVEVSQTREDILEDFKRTKFSRLPVYTEVIDHIEGFIRIKDFVGYFQADKPIGELINKTLFVPENKPISDLLQEMLKQRIQMAIVLDEFGGTAGLITLEDLIEEIVGEIHDEHEEPAEDEIIKLEDGKHMIDGKVLLEDFCKIFDVDVEEEDVDTVGGYIFNREVRIPSVGSRGLIGDREYEISKADDRRIYKITIHPGVKSEVSNLD